VIETLSRFRPAVLKHRLLWSWIAGGVSLLIFLWLMLFRQPLYPSPWFDEGLNTSTAAMLARDGVYALPDSAGSRVLDPAIQTGPIVLLPIALAFRLFGVGIMQARLAMLVFTAFALAAYWLVAKRLTRQAALLAVLFVLVGTLEPYTSFVYMGRQVLGEVPALAFYLLGLLIWWKTLDASSQGPALVLAGLAWGMGMVSKSQMMMLLPVSLGLLALANHFYYRQSTWFAFLVPSVIAIGCVGAWYAAQIAIVGLGQFQENARVLQEGFILHVMGINFRHWENALSVLWKTGWWLWGIPGVVWGLGHARRRSSEGFIHASALAFVLLWLLWFAVLSVGWGRYGFYVLILSPIWTAGLLLDLWRGHPTVLPQPVARSLVLMSIVLYVLVNGRPLATNLIAPTDTGYLAMSNYLATSVPTDAVVESWEWEVSLGAQQPIHHPTTHVTNAYTAYIYSNQPLPSHLYDVQQARPQYILEGPFSGWTGIYRQTLVNADQVAHFGQYALYHLER
jgi:4-amino-4-deoxy-L-arabinose transferase-like glycosyltransferase